MISVFYKGISKEIPPCKHRKRIFWISSNFSQSVLAEYCSYDLHVPGARKVDVGLSPAQFWCQYLKYFSRGNVLKFSISKKHSGILTLNTSKKRKNGMVHRAWSRHDLQLDMSNISLECNDNPEHSCARV